MHHDLPVVPPDRFPRQDDAPVINLGNDVDIALRLSPQEVDHALDVIRTILGDERFHLLQRVEQTPIPAGGPLRRRPRILHRKRLPLGGGLRTGFG